MTNDSTARTPMIATHEDLVSYLHDLFGHEAIRRDELSRHVRECRTERYEDHDEAAIDDLYTRINEALGVVMPPSAWTVGDEVEAGETVEDYDYGTIVKVAGHLARVAWDGSEVTQDVPLSLLRAKGERPIRAEASE